jgi:hypothetical protein
MRNISSSVSTACPANLRGLQEIPGSLTRYVRTLQLELWSNWTRYTKLRKQNPLPHHHSNLLPQDMNALSSSKCKAIQHATQNWRDKIHSLIADSTCFHKIRTHSRAQMQSDSTRYTKIELQKMHSFSATPTTQMHSRPSRKYFKRIHSFSCRI